MIRYRNALQVSAALLAIWLASCCTAVAQSSGSIPALNRQMNALWSAGRIEEAIVVGRELIDLVARTHGPLSPSSANIRNNLAGLYRADGRYGEAEALYRHALSLMEAAGTTRSLDYGTALTNYADLRRVQRRDGEAEQLYKRAHTVLEQAGGRDHPTAGLALGGLASLYRSQGRFADAEPLMRRDIEISQRAMGAGHPDVASGVANLGGLFEDMGRIADAERHYLQALSIYEGALGRDHPFVGTALNNLGLLLSRNGRPAEAERALLRALEIGERRQGPDHPNSGIRMQNLAAVRRDLGRLAEARALFDKARRIAEHALGPEHPHVGRVLADAAGVALMERNWREAFALLDHAAAIAIRHTQRAGAEAGASLESVGRRETDATTFALSLLVKAAHRLGEAEPARRASLMDRAFQVAQWARTSRAGLSLAQMSTRLATGDPAVAALVRGRQDTFAAWQRLDRELISSRARPSNQRDARIEAELATRASDLDLRLSTLDRRLAAAAPGLGALVAPGALSLREVQTLLAPDEALVLVHDTAAWQSMVEESFVWIVSGTRWHWTWSKLGTPGLSREVAALRCGLDATAWYGEGAPKCAEALKIQLDKAPTEGQPLPFDAARAHGLYKVLLGEAGDLIRGKHLLVVASGALTKLPVQVLVTEPPKSGDLSSVRWLLRDHAVTVLPSVAALAALRRAGRPSAATKPMIGFANPLLEGDQADPRDGAWHRQRAEIASARTGCATVTGARSTALRASRRAAGPVSLAAGMADLQQVRMQTPLPETADEVCQVARSIGAEASEMRIGARATEREVKRLSVADALKNYRVLHFATHGLLGGELNGTPEPGLILTPPTQASADDDGYLSASEIANLRLDADWVILSACNTAGGAGGAGAGDTAEALSGLARVFFYAGTRALLVSHWEVDSDAAVKIVTGAVGTLAMDNSLGRAEALRRAILATMADKTRPRSWVPAAHPSVWAPFVIVGEGGAGR